jgi:hypothetical protein
MKYSINVDHKLRLIRFRHSGLINVEDYYEAWNELLALKELTKLKYNLISDYSNGKFQIPVKYLPEIIDFMQEIKNIVREKKQALIVNEPYSVAVSMLFAEKVNVKTRFNIEVFSTETAALKWLAY